MIDAVERRVGDPVLARDMIRVELNRRDSHPEECKPPAESNRDREQTERAHREQATPPRRVFVGFDRERATYARLKPELLAKAEGKFVVIVGDEVIGPLETDEEAARAGYKRFGLGYLYIKQILADEPVVVLPLGVVPCRI